MKPKISSLPVYIINILSRPPFLLLSLLFLLYLLYLMYLYHGIEIFSFRLVSIVHSFIDEGEEDLKLRARTGSVFVSFISFTYLSFPPFFLRLSPLSIHSSYNNSTADGLSSGFHCSANRSQRTNSFLSSSVALTLASVRLSRLISGIGARPRQLLGKTVTNQLLKHIKEMDMI